VLTIPPGALDGDTTITVRELPRTIETVTPVYDFGPDGLVFKIAAQLALTLDADAVAKSPRLGMTHGQGFTTLASKIEAGVLSGDVAHFTGFAGIIDPTADAGGDAGTQGPPVTSIVAGSAHTCFTVAPGTVRCWGSNLNGQIGIGGNGRVPAPVDVPGLVDVAQLAAGDRHTCALSKAGGVKCWGANDHNQLGIKNVVDAGVAMPIDKPQDVPGLTTGVAAISAVGDTTCALMTNGAQRCWGWAMNYEMWAGIPTPPDSLFREQRPLGFAATGFSMSTWNQCFVSTTGEVACTPLTPAGPPTAPATGPLVKPIAGLNGAVEVVMTTDLLAVGYPNDVMNRTTDLGAVCARLSNGTVSCWSRGGDVGGGATTPTPVKLTSGTPLTDAVQLAAGERHACAIFGAAREVTCWGANTFGQLGGPGGSTAAGKIAGLSNVSAITAGGQHTCAAVGADVFCWGSNSYEQIGGKPSQSDSPENVDGIADAVDLFASTYLTCARTAAGGSKCWPVVPDGSVTATTVAGLATDVSALGIGTNAHCAVVNGAVKCWGYSTTGVIQGYKPTPIPIPELATGVVSVTGAMNVACALLGTGVVQCWGQNSDGQLGSGGAAGAQLRPTAVVGLAGATAVSGDDGNVRCALTSAGGVKCWGLDSLLGNGAPSGPAFTNSAVDVGSLTSGVQAIDVGADRICVIMSGGGALKCWGQTTSMLGGITNVPTDIPGFGSGVTHVASGGGGTCAVTTAGTLHCSKGAGSGLVQVAGVADAASAAVGAVHTCVRLKTGAVQCWGRNTIGELGNGRVPKATTPIKIPVP
jgi:alpha-tubulin suppressor-like RCC1 family protein